MGRPSTNKTNNAADTNSVTKAAASSTKNNKFGNAFNQVRLKTFASSPIKEKIAKIDVDYEILIPFGACFITFSQHGQSKQAYIYPLLMMLTNDKDRVYETLRVYMQAVLFCKDTDDRKLKKVGSSTIDVVGLVITFDQQQDHITETNIGANLLKIVQSVVTYANNLARRPYNGEAAETFTYKNEFRVGNNYTRPLPNQRHLGHVISPEDSVTYMEKILHPMTFNAIVNDEEIMTSMYGTIEEGKALVTIARPGFIPREDGNGDQPDHGNDDKDIPLFVAEP